MELADILLKNDNNEYNLDSVKAYVEKKEEKKMMMTNKTPIYIQYISCAADDKNRLIFYKDIYGYDEKIRKIFFE
jgi:murein L,D-transpeptidase YcbB/YkuD